MGAVPGAAEVVVAAADIVVAEVVAQVVADAATNDATSKTQCVMNAGMKATTQMSVGPRNMKCMHLPMT